MFTPYKVPEFLIDRTNCPSCDPKKMLSLNPWARFKKFKCDICRSIWTIEKDILEKDESFRPIK